MISTRVECEALVAACRYPPNGIRSFGPTRSLVSIGSDYLARAESFALTFALIETAEGLANVEAIASVPGLSGLYVGPWDLSLGMGLPQPGDLLDEDLLRACDTILEAARGHKLIAGIYTNSAEDGCRMAARGFRLVNIASDTALLQRGASAEIRKAKGSAAS
jgi:4-hydroxy-2-oxoheptanedioate aldolase